MGERFMIEICDEVTDPVELQMIVDKALDWETELDDDTIFFSCFLVELANEWRVKLDNIKWPDKPGTHILVTMPDGSAFEVIE